METLTLEQVSYLADIIGIVIVIMSLIYVGKQISQNNRSQRISAVQLHNDTYRQNLSLLADHAEVWIAGLQKYSQLEASKQIEFGMIIQSILRHIEQSHFMMREGVLKENTYAATLSNVSNIMSYQGTKDWQHTRRAYFDAEFTTSLETYMEKNEGEDLYQILQNN